MFEHPPKSIILSLFSRNKHESKAPSPKNYPFGVELVQLLKENNIFTIQVAVKEESDLDCNTRYDNLSFKELLTLLTKTPKFISVDNFFPHFAHFYGKNGIVLFGQSNPSYFGYKDNVNLFKDSGFFRKNRSQYQFWETVPYIKNAFVEPSVVLESVNKYI